MGLTFEAMLDQNYNMPNSASEILGDLTAFAEELGSAAGLGSLSVTATSIASARMDSLPALRGFLDEYLSGALIPHELPEVMRAYEYAVRSEARELIALDREVGQRQVIEEFAAASSQVGKTQLRRLRPLRSERVVQRYLKSVDAGESSAWHTLVFGLVLGLYSLPLRQGLVHFAHQTLAGFVAGAGRRLTMEPAERQEMVSAYFPPITAAVDVLLAGPELRIVEVTGQS